MCDFCCEGLPPGGAEVDVAVLFADVRGSTGLAEQMGARAFAELLNRFYGTATDILVRRDAIVDKMIGDEVMALFLPGYCGPDYPMHAVAAAEELLRAVGHGAPGKPWLPLAAGIHAGTAFVGNVGGGGVTDFTALGDTVNVAARLQGEGRNGEIILSDTVYRQVEARYPQAEGRVVALRGREEPMTVRVLRIGNDDADDGADGS